MVPIDHYLIDANWGSSSDVVYVLLTETREGDARRLGAIGHLHEAEDESQAFGDLHAAIRAVRKADQSDATLPDREALAEAVEIVRQASP